MKHPYAEILHAIADGKRVQCETMPNEWRPVPDWFALYEIGRGSQRSSRYRINPDDVEPVAEESSVAGVDQDLLFAWLAHGDDEHREWLRKAIATFFSCGKWPDPTGMSDLEAERTARQTAQRQLADLQELQAKSGLAHRKAVQDAVAEECDACAFACETLHAPECCTGVERSLWDVATLACADAIRARKKP